MKTVAHKRVSREQFAAACKENRSKGAVCWALGISRPQAFRLECLYDIDLPSKNPSRSFDYDEIYETYLKNERNSKKTAKIIGCAFGTVLKVVRRYEEGEKK
jgi:hypothetical protein